MKSSFLCRWVRDRLPLVAGDELPGLERRRVERHLIGCPNCRRRRTALTGVLNVLHAAAAPAAIGAGPDAPSLWPALARQIRESRRPVPAAGLASFPFSFSFSLARFRFGLAPALGLGLGAMIATVLSMNAHRGQADSEARIRASARPIAAMVSAPAPSAAAPAPVRDLPVKPGETPVVDNTPPKIDYDLEHGTPMPPDARNSRDTRPTY